MAERWCEQKCFLNLVACGVALGLLLVSGLSCVIYQESSTIVYGLPTTGCESKSYITPECPLVEEVLRHILGNSPYEPSKGGFDNIRDWVAYNIDYISDEELWGVDDYWQTPEETLSLRTGDCEDFAILLCSLLRAYGIDAEHIYVALSIDDEEYGHAFLIENWSHDGEWWRIEPQAPAQLSSWHSWFGLRIPHPDSALDKYEITVAFNDLYYYNESFSWGEEQANFWTLAEMATAVGNIARRLSQLLRALFGLLFN